MPGSTSTGQTHYIRGKCCRVQEIPMDECSPVVSPHPQYQRLRKEAHMLPEFILHLKSHTWLHVVTFHGQSDLFLSSLVLYGSLIFFSHLRHHHLAIYSTELTCMGHQLYALDISLVSYPFDWIPSGDYLWPSSSSQVPTGSYHCEAQIAILMPLICQPEVVKLGTIQGTPLSTVSTLLSSHQISNFCTSTSLSFTQQSCLPSILQQTRNFHFTCWQSTCHGMVLACVVEHPTLHQITSHSPLPKNIKQIGLTSMHFLKHSWSLPIRTSIDCILNMTSQVYVETV